MTPHISRFTKKRSTLAIATAVAAGALLTAGMTTGASAQPVADATPGAAPMKLSGAARAASSRTPTRRRPRRPRS